MLEIYGYQSSTGQEMRGREVGDEGTGGVREIKAFR